MRFIIGIRKDKKIVQYLKNCMVQQKIFIEENIQN